MAGYAQPDPEALSGPQRWLLAQESFIIRAEGGKENLAAEWKATAGELVERGYLKQSRSGRYWPTDEGRAVVGGLA